MSVRILQGDARERLSELAVESIDCIITSVPYFGLRSYLPAGHALKAKELGLERSIASWLENQLCVFAQCHRLLKKRGVLWVNIGDSYYSPRYNGGIGRNSTINGKGSHEAFREIGRVRRHTGLKSKDRMGMPHRLVFALQAQGWWWRDEVIWAKPNPMPESAKDRTTRAHEFFFMLTKSERYYHSRRAYQEPAEQEEIAQGFRGGSYTNGAPGPRTARGNRRRKAVGNWVYGSSAENPGHQAKAFARSQSRSGQWPEVEHTGPLTRNRRSVWSLATQPYKGAHYATFPTWLVEPALLFSCPPGGTVLDPFGGVGTVALVAERHQRDSILVELNPVSCAEAHARLLADAPLLTHIEVDYADAQVRDRRLQRADPARAAGL